MSLLWPVIMGSATQRALAASKKKIEKGEYSGIFSLNKPDFGVFWNDSEVMCENKRGYFGSVETHMSHGLRQSR
jgi:hypothetical protein